MKSKFTRFRISKVSSQDRQTVPPPQGPTDQPKAAVCPGREVSR